MITVNAVLTLDGEEIVPVRAIPYVTGGDMRPKCLAGILSDPDHWFFAFVLGPNNTVTQMLPKNWTPYRDQLTVIASGANNLDISNRATLEVLPPSTFVYWEALWRTHEACFLPAREELYGTPLAEQANYGLQPNAIIPKELFELVFEGFQVPWVSPGPNVVPSTSNTPIVIAASQIAAPSPGTMISVATGLVSWSVKNPKRRDPLTDALVATLTNMRAAGQARPKARDILDEFRSNKPAEIVEVGYDELKYETSSGNNKLVSIGALQKRLNKLLA